MSKFPAVLRWPSQCTAKHSQLGSVQPQVDNTEHFQWTLAVMLWNFSVKVKELAAFQNFIPHLFGNTYPGGREKSDKEESSPFVSTLPPVKKVKFRSNQRRIQRLCAKLSSQKQKCRLIAEYF